MVRALIELDEETNRILNMVKAKHSLKDKGRAIEFVVKKYRDVEQPLELQYIDDGDKWILGEDIPDIGLFFSQIWLSCFVNEFEQSGGKAYKKILSIYNDYNQLFYYGEKDSYEVGEHLVRRFLNEPEFIPTVNEEIIKWADKLRNFCKTLPERNLNMLSNLELWELYEEHDKIHTEYYQWGWIPVAVDMFHNNLTEKLKEYLRSIKVPEDKINEKLFILTQPDKKSLIQIEREEFLQLAALIKNDSYHKKLFQELYKRFREQEVTQFGYKTHTKEYEELLERKVSELIAHIKPEIIKKIREHYGKYFYVNHMWVGKAFTLEYYLKELVKLIANNMDAETTLKEAEKEFQKGIEARKELIKQLNIDRKWRTVFDGFADFMITKIYRRFAQIYALYKMDFILEEIARRYNLTIKHLRYMLPEEVKALLIKEKIDREEITERTKFCAYYAEKGKDIIYTGVKARELAEKAKKIEIKEVTELKGQVGCMGKARGIVKQIFRPDDMAKMNQGDILVSIATDPDIVSAMKKAAAIVTEQGGVTSHAAIVARELRIPCVIGTKIATKVLKDGDEVEVDANKGIVKIIKRNN